ncbi:hypothetical protein JTE90_004766 [Oedothorax gibbosus]|uniref:Transposase n=1 Tax=Oedothorax gibbosus TaxID=931172 RepID=A0AAV6UXL0_9ARAC|nr:hypothetical protein JTE90_004766 [Oedothorax gibbosus]
MHIPPPPHDKDVAEFQTCRLQKPLKIDGTALERRYNTQSADSKGLRQREWLLFIDEDPFLMIFINRIDADASFSTSTQLTRHRLLGITTTLKVPTLRGVRPREWLYCS